MKLSCASSLALILNLVTGAPSGLEAREPGNRPINVSEHQTRLKALGGLLLSYLLA